MGIVTDNNAKIWYGKFGGCFLADPFTVSCDKLYQDYIQITNNPEFADKYNEMLKKFDKNQHEFQYIDEQNENILVNKVSLNIHSIIGQALVARELGKKQVVCGVRFTDEALFVSQICSYLNLPLKLFLSGEIVGVESVIKYIKALGTTVETQICKEIFNLPEMYAFQDWVGNPEETLYINCRCNVGAYPATNITSDFSKLYGQQLIKSYINKYKKMPKRVIVPCITGSTALSVFKPMLDKDIQLITVEIADEKLQQELDSYCGTLTIVMRDNVRDRIIAPELAYCWDTGLVKREFVSSNDTAVKLKELNSQGIFLSIESAAAVSMALSFEDDEDTFVVIGDQRMGALI